MRGRVSLILTAAALFLTPVQAGAESYFELYGGKGRGDVETDGVRVSSNQKGSRAESIDSPLIVGVRYRRWFDSYPGLGIALDISNFSLPGERLDLSGVTSFSVMGMFRYGLMKSDTYPNGRIQPYAAAGLGWFTADVYANLSPEISQPISGSGDGMGIDTRLGVSWFITPDTAFFTEFRYADFDLKVENEAHFLYFTTDQIASTLDTDVTVQQFLIGFSFKL